MPAEITSISLLELHKRIKSGIQDLFPESYWIVAEISEINTNQSGHCYLELIEKSTEDEKIVAKARATIWSFTFRMLKPYFESTTGQRLTVGIKVLIKASVEFHELFGLSLNIKDIDPTYTVGEMARRKQEIINRLLEEGVFDLNKELDLPILPKRIAVISSNTAAGFGDFTNQLKHNAQGYKFYPVLFPSFMQGDETERSVIRALERIYEAHEHFDLVVIIRGGGSQSELNYFNNYNIAFHITQFPLPVITGIGHERDQTITDLVAHTSLKTPTAVADFIISLMDENAVWLENLEERLVSYVTDFLEEGKSNLENLSHRIQAVSKLRMAGNQSKFVILSNHLLQLIKRAVPEKEYTLEHLRSSLISHAKLFTITNKNSLHQKEKLLISATKAVLREEMHKINSQEVLLKVLDPKNILERGYSITYFNGKALKSGESVKPDDVLETHLSEGIIHSKVVK